MSADELAALNWVKRVRLVNFAFENIPFYREKYSAAGFAPGDLKTPDDFERLPVLEKEELRHRADDIIAPGVAPARLGVATTGGSTGVPLKTYFDKSLPRNAYGWRMLEWWNCRASDNAAFLYRAVPEGWRRNLAWWRPGHVRRLFLSAASLSDADFAGFVTRCRRHRPSYICGYVGAVYQFAEYLRRNNIGGLGFRAVWTTSAPLPEPQRRFIEQAFGCPAYSQYGCCEMYYLAAECGRRNSLHIFSDIRHIETVDARCRAAAPGEYGEILLTNLEDFCFPLIRYRNGDRGRLRPGVCDCGVNLPLMDPVKGRTTDMVTLPDGRVISGDFLTAIFDDFPEAVNCFQIHQRSDYSIDIYYVPAGSDRSAVNTVAARLNDLVRGGANIRWHAVEAIAHDAGKQRFVLNDLRIAEQGVRS